MNPARALRLALAAADQSNERYKLGAIVFKRKPISAGFNKTNRSWEGGTTYGHWAGSLHAEIAALIAARSSVKGASIFVARKGARLAKPCSACMAALKEAGLKSVYYTSDHGISFLQL